MRSLELKIPPLLLVAVFALIMWLVSMVTSSFNIVPGIRYTGALVIAGAGIVFCLFGVLHFRKAKTTVNPLDPGSTTALVSSGIYGISRNPMYVGFLLLLLSWALMLSNLYALVVALMFVPYLSRFQILPEERALETLFGDDYRDYKNRVRRWL